jgi:hypothetical protein
MPKERVPFGEKQCEAYLGVLRKLALEPPSSNSIDPSLVKKVQTFLDSEEEKTPTSVWNIYKEVLDLIVYTSGASGFFLALFDLEPFMKAPGNGSYSFEEGNMDNAPWRAKLR